MKNRIKKKNLYSRSKLPRQFVKDTKRALAEAKAGKLTPYKYGSHILTPEERAWESVAPVGREFGSPDYERLTRLDAQADEAEVAANRSAFAKEIHPGEILLKEFIEPRNLTPEQLAADLGWSPSRMEALLQGIQPISAEIALNLGLFFNMEAKFWLNLQAEYDKQMRAKALR